MVSNLLLIDFVKLKVISGSAKVEQVPMTEQYKLWADAASSLYGGLDILAVDVLHGKDGNDYIIEVNDTGMGVLDEAAVEDNGYIRDLALQRINEAYGTK
jgi:glutathione synthase/RimK-type ligase-like ATP-grasp enzyme